MSSLDKSSFVLGNELWEEHFESLLALVKAYIIDIWEERKSTAMLNVHAQQPHPHSPTGDLRDINGVNGQNSKGMCQGGKPGTGKLYTYFMLLRPHQWVGVQWPRDYGGALSINPRCASERIIKLLKCSDMMSDWSHQTGLNFDRQCQSFVLT